MTVLISANGEMVEISQERGDYVKRVSLEVSSDRQLAEGITRLEGHRQTLGEILGEVLIPFTYAWLLLGMAVIPIAARFGGTGASVVTDPATGAVIAGVFAVSVFAAREVVKGIRGFLASRRTKRLINARLRLLSEISRRGAVSIAAFVDGLEDISPRRRALVEEALHSLLADGSIKAYDDGSVRAEPKKRKADPQWLIGAGSKAPSDDEERD